MVLLMQLLRWIPICTVLVVIQEWHRTLALQLTNMNVPEVVDYRDTVTLSCSYNLGAHQLNSVKWYKGNKEFYRYAPMLFPKVTTYPVDGIVIATDRPTICNQYLCSIRLTELQRRSSGEYRCEISGDAPEFKLANGTRNMTVEVLPQKDPTISGLSASYLPHEHIAANCTSDQSSLATRLLWFINGRTVPMEYLQQQQETTLESDGFNLRFRMLEMRVPVDRLVQRELDNVIHIKCIASVDAVPSMGRESQADVALRSHRSSLFGFGGHSRAAGRSFFGPRFTLALDQIGATSLLLIASVAVASLRWYSGQDLRQLLDNRP
ncbi:pregnancy-specific beta-1-glycoprotein 11-like [Anopheles nili]|uniref:pregnancy-specific beta-1-glycoprotein 11-like n=1 Tax=Anopheles nili TaxID=185578 RepID=UPI00237AD4E8|nr:pregnancy-specific beta-1-glycoprotein 11-like [Anopheles nili]